MHIVSVTHDVPTVYTVVVKYLGDTMTYMFKKTEEGVIVVCDSTRFNLEDCIPEVQELYTEVTRKYQPSLWKRFKAFVYTK